MSCPEGRKEKDMNILEYIDELMSEGYTEEEAYLFADEAFGLYEPEEDY